MVDVATKDLFLAQDGDDAAFSRLVQACDAHVRRFCVWFCRPGDEVDDVVQETFLRAYRGLGSFRGDSSAHSWLLSIARRVCLDFAAKKTKELSIVIQLRHVPSAVEDTAQPVEIHQLIAALPFQFREAFVLVRILGFGYDEAAAIMKCPRGTVQSRVARARESLALQVAIVETRQIS